MKKAVSTLIGMLAVASLLVGVTAVPASADDGEWSQSGCSGPYYTSRPDVWWYGVPGQGSYYMWLYHNNNAARWVGTGFYQKYAQQGHECGWLGAPDTDVYSAGALYPNGTYTIQRFQGGHIAQYYGTMYYCNLAYSSCWLA